MSPGRAAIGNSSGAADFVRAQGPELKAAWVDHFSGVPWEFMATLTFDPRRNTPSRSAAVAEGEWWCGQLGRLRRASVGWIFVVERGAGGQAQHLHALVTGFRPLDPSVPASMWDARNGHAHVRDVNDRRKAVEYVTKNAYLTGDVHFSDDLARHLRVHRLPVGVDIAAAAAASSEVTECNTASRVILATRTEPAEVLEFLTPAEFMRHMRLGRTTVYEGLRDGTIPSVRIGKSYRIPRGAIDKMVQGVE